jgi:transposase
MSKHSASFKQVVVGFYGDVERSYREVSLHFGLDHSIVRRWVASYAEHGLGGLARKHSHYDAQFRLLVLERMWKDGLSRREVAVLFDIRKPPITGIATEGPQGDEAKSREELLAELAYLRVENDYLKKSGRSPAGLRRPTDCSGKFEAGGNPLPQTLHCP